MGINEHISAAVTSFTEDLQTQLYTQVNQQVRTVVDKIDVSAIVRDTVKSTVTDFVVQREFPNSNVPEWMFKTIQDQLDVIVENFITDLTDKIAVDITNTVKTETAQKISQIDISKVVQDRVASVLKNYLNSADFPDHSIPGTAINSQGLAISGDNVYGGTIKNFGSTGIEDKATTCQVTILDNGTVFENTLYSPRLEVKGDTVIDGDLILKGSIPVDSLGFQMIVNEASISVRKGMDSEFFKNYNDILLSTIKTDGLDLNKLTINGKVVVDGNQLGAVVSESSLQTVGTLRSLETSGQAYLAKTLVATNGRVGVNTIEPSTAFDLWDQEVQVKIGKYQKGTARIAVQNGQTLVLSSDEQDTLICEKDGSVTVQQLNVGTGVHITSSDTAPNSESQKGHIVFNSNPSLGGPLGWVCLGGHNWANFGIID
jgi:hypothetical protein